MACKRQPLLIIASKNLEKNLTFATPCVLGEFTDCSIRVIICSMHVVLLLTLDTAGTVEDVGF